MINKGRGPALRYVPRTQKIDLDWLFERMREDPALSIKYVGTKEQIADIFTKGNFSSDTWCNLCRLAQIGSPESLERGGQPSKKKSGATPAMLRCYHAAQATSAAVLSSGNSAPRRYPEHDTQ